LALFRSSVRRSGWVVLVVAGLALAGCGTAADPSARKTDADARSKTQVPSPEPVVTAWPLTGLPMDDNTVVRPALNVKIENDRTVRPQTGLEYTDIVWEEVVEGGITRFVAVYHSQVPEEVGPVRSNRPMDPRIAGPSRGLIVFSGGMYTSQLRAAGLQAVSMDEGTAGFYRKVGFRAPHNVFGTPQTWWDLADDKHRNNPPPQFTYAPAKQATAFASGTPAALLELTLSASAHPSWSWDAASGTWLRSEGTTPSSSRAGVRLSAVNVIVIKAPIVNTPDRDPAGSPVPDTKFEGTGTALVATGGKTITATWTKASDTEVVVLTTSGGEAINLAPGNTWVELMPTDRTWVIF